MNDNGKDQERADKEKRRQELKYWDIYIEFLEASIDILTMEKERCIVKRALKELPTEKDMLNTEAMMFPLRDFQVSEMMRDISYAANQIISRSGDLERKVTFEEALKLIKNTLKEPESDRKSVV